jgi:hypothetical protein
MCNTKRTHSFSDTRILLPWEPKVALRPGRKGKSVKGLRGPWMCRARESVPSYFAQRDSMPSFENGKCQSVKIRVCFKHSTVHETSAQEIFETIQLLSSSVWNHSVIFRWYLDDIWMILMWYSCGWFLDFQPENSLKEFISDSRIQNPTRSFTTNCR